MPVDEHGQTDDLSEIRATYERYERAGRSAMWDLGNPGYRRLVLDRDAALDATITSSVEASRHATGSPRLLDVGCGTGQLATRLHATYPEVDVTGVDLLAQRIDVARSQAPWATFRVGSADHLPDADGAFDIATATTLFSSISSPELEKAVAREIGRVLRPGGWLVWYDIRFDNPWNPAVHAVSRERLGQLFPGWTAELRPIGVPPPIARRMGRLTPVMYPMLHAIRPIRSHLVGRLQRPR